MQLFLNGRINGIVIMLHTNKLNLGHRCKIEMLLIVTAWDAEAGKGTIALENVLCI